MATVLVRFFAGAAERAGVNEEQYADVTDLADLRARITQRRGPKMAALLANCSFLANGQLVADPTAPFEGTVRMDVLPPFAGG